MKTLLYIVLMLTITFGSNAYQKINHREPATAASTMIAKKQPIDVTVEQPLYIKASKTLQFLFLLHVLIFNNVAFCCRLKKSDKMTKFIKSSLKCLILGTIFLVINNLLIFGTIFTRETTFWNGNLVTVTIAFGLYALFFKHKSPLFHTIAIWLVLTFVR